MADDSVDVAFSYITLQHCDRDDAMGLVREALRVVRPGGRVALNFRSWSGVDPFVLPAGATMRALFRAPGIGSWLSHKRFATRLAWQANRLDPHQVIGPIQDRLTDIVVWRNPARNAPLWGVKHATQEHFEGINRNHWWLVASVT
jgi:SAM-dependent methyltransferase